MKKNRKKRMKDVDLDEFNDFEGDMEKKKRKNKLNKNWKRTKKETY